MLSFLRRNLLSSQETKSMAYMYMVIGRSNLEYCTTVWSPYKKEHIHKLEMVQRCAAWFVTTRFHNTSSVIDMIDWLQWETLEAIRCKLQLTLFYKLVNNIVDIDNDLHIIPAMTKTRATHSRKFRQISISRDCFQCSFSLDLSLFGTNSQHYCWGPWLGTLQAGALHPPILNIR